MPSRRRIKRFLVDVWEATLGILVELALPGAICAVYILLTFILWGIFA